MKESYSIQNFQFQKLQDSAVSGTRNSEYEGIFFLDPEFSEMVQFQVPETAYMLQFLYPSIMKIDHNISRYRQEFIVQMKRFLDPLIIERVDKASYIWSLPWVTILRLGKVRVSLPHWLGRHISTLLQTPGQDQNQIGPDNIFLFSPLQISLLFA